jgi:hypothetical protein
MYRIFVLGLLICSLNGQGQTAIASYRLEIAFNKTTNLIFPFSIKNVDRGSPDIIVEQSKSVDNLLEVKAAKENFLLTNLSVVTADGKLYSFLVRFMADPAVLNISFQSDSATGFYEKPFLHLSVKSEGVRLRLRSIYTRANWIWFTLQVSNHSHIDFKPDDTRFFIEGSRHAKRKALHKTMINPVFSSEIPVISGGAEKEMRFAFPSFTIPEGKKLLMEISENQGGRQLILPVSHRTILKARLLP